MALKTTRTVGKRVSRRANARMALAGKRVQPQALKLFELLARELRNELYEKMEETHRARGGNPDALFYSNATMATALGELELQGTATIVLPRTVRGSTIQSATVGLMRKK